MRMPDRLKPGLTAGAASAFVAALLVTQGGSAAVASPVSPASVCTTPGCGGVVTNGASNLPIRITNNWCWSDRSRYEGDSLPCVTHANDPNHYQADFELPSRQTSKSYYYYYDTDAYRIYRGCVVRGNEGGSTFDIDRRGKPSLWIKISNGTTVNIASISC